MCGRFTLRTPAETIASLFPGLDVPEFAARYNIAPTQQVPCIRASEVSNREVVPLRWGLIPFWAKDSKIGARMINARSETVATKPAFRSAFKKRRCLVIADGYFEWKKIGKEKQPFYMTVGAAEDKPTGFCMAGLWEKWHDQKNDLVIESCSILTTDASPSLAALHDRMPVIVESEDREFWLDPQFSDREKLESLCKPAADGYFQSVPVSKTVNNVRNQEADCVVPIQL